MIQKKICMLGASAVGKTSLVSRFVQSIYSDKYHTTVGVKIDKKLVNVGDKEVNLLLWDVEGADEAQNLKASYLRGAAGYILVADGTRRSTLYTAVMLQKSAQEIVGPVPFILVTNKSDLVEQWELDDREVEALSQKGWSVTKASAKTGAAVEEAFLTLSRKMVEA